MATDLLLVGQYFYVWRRNLSLNLSATILSLIVIGLLVQSINTSSVDVATLYQGFRKSLLWLLAIVVGLNLNDSGRRIVMKTIALTLALVCLYGVKQFLFFSDFDRALLAAQSSGEYANVIAGRQRAISVLSSGFHLGMAGCLLCALALFSQSWTRLRAALVVGLAGFAVYASFTRTFLLIFALLVISRCALTSWYRSAVALVATAVCLMLLAFVGVDVISLVLDSVLSDDRFTNRQASYELFGSYMGTDAFRWFLGFGPGSAGSTLGSSFDVVSAPWIEPHSIFLKYIFEYGIVLAAILLACIAQIACRADEIIGIYDRRLAWVSLAILLISGLTITSVEATPVSIYVGLVFGIMAQRTSSEFK